MMYASVIIDISHENVDKTFQYRIPESLEGRIFVGTPVRVPFGNSSAVRNGYVVEVTDRPEIDPARIRDLDSAAKEGVTAQSRLIQLAWWMKEHCGCTMNQALKTVLPVRQKVRQQKDRQLRCLLNEEERREAALEAARKHYAARQRLLEAFAGLPVLPYDQTVRRLRLSAAVIRGLEEKGILAVESQTRYRMPEYYGNPAFSAPARLNPEQQAAADDFCARYDRGERGVFLLFGITGSGKTEVYMEMIRHVLEQGRQAIVLIPEIALTYQTVQRFYSRFGRRIAVMHSRLSDGERYDQFERARTGDASVMIGPRSALFAPFPDPGLIVVDEEHETSYQSETVPRYHARDAARQLANLAGASLVLGSATPSLESYTRALSGEYRLYRLTGRAKPDSAVSQVQVVDLREELKSGNKSMFSRALAEAVQKRLDAGQQTMLFINRRGYAGFVSCRSCGTAMRCPHCDVSLTLHGSSRLVCHYCGYQQKMPDRCPVCGSPYIAAFGTGTQKIQAMAARQFPGARILRMDLDTTSRKGGHEAILAAFRRHEADILVGTQMIVKGHDFPDVTLVGILAADLSLYSPDFRCGERTFQLLTQAAGRAGRDRLPGEVIIQTYQPDHYAIACAAAQDYETFYQQEMAYRRALRYPPAAQMLCVLLSSGQEEALNLAAEELAGAASGGEESGVQVIGPAEAPVYKVNDIYRKILYLKQENYDILIKIRSRLEQIRLRSSWKTHVSVQFSFA